MTDDASATEATIAKTVYAFTVLHRVDEKPVGLEDAIAQSYEGHAVGMETSEETTPITDDDVEDELVTLHNDGTFFDIDLGREDKG